MPDIREDMTSQKQLKNNIMNFDRLIWKLFKMNRCDFNRFDIKVTALLQEVYEKGKKDGRKEVVKRIRYFK